MLHFEKINTSELLPVWSCDKNPGWLKLLHTVTLSPRCFWGATSKLSWNESSLLLSFVSDVQMHSVVLGTVSNGKPRQIPTKVLQENFLHASKFGKKKKRAASIFRVACFWRLKFTMVFKMPSSNALDQLVSAANERALCVWSYNFL